MIYKRFTEKSAEEWRQIYKALQLMEFLVKNGSERVIDDARSHLSLLKMLKQFHYIDEHGKDQGLNVRNRSKELTDLLSDVDRIRSERKKARATRNKYGGVEGGVGIGGSGMSTAGRYGGFGSESAGMGASYGGSTRGVYGDGGGFGGESQMDYEEPSRSSSRRQDRFDEYDEYDDGGAQATPGRRKADAPSRRTAPKKAEPPKPKEPEVDLFDFGDDNVLPSNGSASVLAAPPASTSMSAAPAVPAASSAPAEDDDFDDFQSATPQPITTTAASTIPKPNYSSISTSTPSANTQYAQPTPQQGSQPQAAAFSNIFSTVSPPSSTSATPSQAGKAAPFSPPTGAAGKPAGYNPAGPNYFTSVQTASTSAQSPGVTSPGSIGSGNKLGGNAAAKKPAGGDAFASLLGGAGMKKAEKPKGMTIAEMNRQKAQAGLYGVDAAPAAQQPQGQGQQKPAGGSAMDDLLG